jgi:hypothetical protein
MNIFEFTELILDKNDAIQFLRDREILRSDRPICTNPQCDRVIFTQLTFEYSLYLLFCFFFICQSIMKISSENSLIIY